MNRNRSERLFERLGASAIRFFFGNGGAAAMEYAWILAMVGATGVGAYLVVAAGTDQVFARTASRIGATTGLQTASNGRASSSAATAGGYERRELPAAAQSDASSQVAFGVGWLLVWAALAGTSLGLSRGSARLWRHMVARARRRHDASAPAPRELLERLFVKRQQMRRLLVRRLGRTSAFDAQVQHLMSPDVACVDPHTRYPELLQTMAGRRIRHLLVCRKNGPLLGIISDRDVQHRRGATAEAIMTPNPLTVEPQSPVAPAITLMVSRSVSCLPVVSERGAVRGILTTTDLMLSLQCTLQVLEGLASGVCSIGPEPAEDASDDTGPSCPEESDEDALAGSTTGS